MKAVYQSKSQVKEFEPKDNMELNEVQDRDAAVPSDKSTSLGKLRADVSSVKDQINDFLTANVKRAKLANGSNV